MFNVEMCKENSYNKYLYFCCYTPMKLIISSKVQKQLPEVSWNRGTSINISCTTRKRKQGKNLVIFLQDALKIAF